MTATDRNEAIKTIRAALKRRSGLVWSVTGERWGGPLTITAPPARRNGFGCMTDADAAELGDLLSLNRPAHRQGVSVPASTYHRQEYIDRAEGRAPSGVPDDCRLRDTAGRELMSSDPLIRLLNAAIWYSSDQSRPSNASSLAEAAMDFVLAEARALEAQHPEYHEAFQALAEHFDYT